MNNFVLFNKLCRSYRGVNRRVLAQSRLARLDWASVTGLVMGVDSGRR